LNRYDGKVFAMKRLNKDNLFDNNLLPQVKREVEVQYKLNHPNITKLYDYFSTESDVYLILEYCNNGNLYQKRSGRHKKKFTEKEAAFYVREIAKALEYCHKHNIAHRDVKLENVLLKGNQVKLADFGWCIQYKENEKSNILCGTLDYMSPEMVISKNYRFEVDIWALGILTFELLCGKTPFEKFLEKQEIYDAIENYDFEIPDNLSENAIDFLEGCLDETEYRMTIKEVISHPWLK
jgi:aurora kinase